MDMPNLPPILKKKIGPLPLGAWIIVGGAGVGIAIMAKKRMGGGGVPAGMLPEDDATDPYAVGPPVIGYGGGGVGDYGNAPATPPPDVSLPYLPITDAASPGLVRATSVPGSPGNCPAGYYWDGNVCRVKTVAGPAKVQPGATPGAAP